MIGLLDERLIELMSQRLFRATRAWQLSNFTLFNVPHDSPRFYRGMDAIVAEPLERSLSQDTMGVKQLIRPLSTSDRLCFDRQMYNYQLRFRFELAYLSYDCCRIIVRAVPSSSL